MKGRKYSHDGINTSVHLVIATLITLTSSATVQAGDISLKILGNNELDQISAAGATSTAHAFAGATGLHTLAGTGTRASVYVDNCGYTSAAIGSGLGWAIAGGAASVAEVEVNVSVSSTVTRSHQVSHSVHIPQSGSSYASGYSLVVSYTRNGATL